MVGGEGHSMGQEQKSLIAEFLRGAVLLDPWSVT